MAKHSFNLIVEALFHIRKGSVGQTQQKIPRKQRKKLGKDAFGKFDLKDYNGIDTQYFDGRTIEYNALAWAHNDGFLKKWFEEYNMETGKWKETVPKSLVKHLGSALLLPIND